MRDFWQSHMDAILALAIPIIIDALNRCTKDWRERKTKLGVVFGFLLEALNTITWRKPDLSRQPVSLYEEKEPTEK